MQMDMRGAMLSTTNKMCFCQTGANTNHRCKPEIKMETKNLSIFPQGSRGWFPGFMMNQYIMATIDASSSGFMKEHLLFLMQKEKDLLKWLLNTFPLIIDFADLLMEQKAHAYYSSLERITMAILIASNLWSRWINVWIYLWLTTRMKNISSSSTMQQSTSSGKVL